MGFTNPVFNSNFPDPMIIIGPDGTYWAFATNRPGSGGTSVNIQTLNSADLKTWTPGPDALPNLPAWSRPGRVWAPEVAQLSNGQYAMYYTTIAPDPAIQCISVAIADSIEGPYVDQRSAPLICEDTQGGSIDASPFVASDGKSYLYWKNDGNAVGVDTWVSVQELGPDGTELVGEPLKLIKQDLPWEGHLIEAPFVWESDGIFHLFYSANDFGSADYGVGHATATSPIGPFTKTPDPILVSNEVTAGPGHCSLFEKDGQVWMVYHAWAPDAIGSEAPGRTMWLSEVHFASDGTVEVVPPTLDYPNSP